LSIINNLEFCPPNIPTLYPFILEARGGGVSRVFLFPSKFSLKATPHSKIFVDDFRYS